MRRLPIYFLVDVSESMVGEPIEQVQQGMRTIIQELRTNPYALETAYVSIIAFAGKAITLSPLTELYKFYPPTFPVGSGTSLGVAMNHLMLAIDHDIQRTTMEVKGDWKPIIFLFTDGTPTDNAAKAVARWNSSYRKHCNLVAISLGEKVNTKVLTSLSDHVLRLKETDAESFQKFFKWISASIQQTSVSVTEAGSDELHLPSRTGINLEKVDSTNACDLVDENFAVLPGKCSNTKQMYLAKYTKHAEPTAAEVVEPTSSALFHLLGAYPIDGEKYQQLSPAHSTQTINTQMLRGVPNCPCCGNQFGVVVCGCGNVMCSGGVATCPWCGTEGRLTAIRDGGINVNRGKG